jgi:hypothetical protein
LVAAKSGEARNSVKCQAAQRKPRMTEPASGPQAGLEVREGEPAPAWLLEEWPAEHQDVEEGHEAGKYQQPFQGGGRSRPRTDVKGAAQLPRFRPCYATLVAV